MRSPSEALTSLRSLPPSLSRSPQIMTWQAVIFGPDDTPWEGGTFKLLLEFTEDYPNKVGREGGREEGREGGNGRGTYLCLGARLRKKT